MTIPSVFTGDPIGGWKGLANGKNAIQATNSARPELVLNVQNGLSGVSFDRVAQFLVLTTDLSQNEFSLFMVFNTETVAQTSILGGNSNNPQAAVNFSSIGEMVLTFNGSDTGGSSAIGTPTTNYSLLEYLTDGTTVSYYQNGISYGTSAVSGTNAGFTTIGALENGSALTFGGNLLELLFIPTYLTATKRQQVEQFINNEWRLGF
jgi:hypothetical protein